MAIRVARARILQASVSGGQLAAGVRAGPGLVGYLGTETALTMLSFGGFAPAGTSWAGDGTYLQVTSANTVLDGYKIPYEVVVRAANVTIQNCKILTGSGTIYGIHGDTASSGSLTVRDTTIHRSNASAGDVSGALSTVGATLKAYRCDISGTADAIQPNLGSGETVISQCCVHDLALVDVEAHLDCVQPFQGSGSGSRAITIEHCHLDAIGTEDPALMEQRSAIVTPNSAVTLGQNAANGFEQYDPVVVNNCNLGGGVLHLRILWNVANATITNNRFGPIADVGTHVIENAAAIATWSGNVDHLGNPVNQ